MTSLAYAVRPETHLVALTEDGRAVRDRLAIRRRAA